MAKNPQKKDDSFFETMYDLDGDGRTDFSEAALMFMIYDEMTKEDSSSQADNYSNVQGNIVDLDDLDIEGI